ncbi:bifunctional DNA primase/polymerase [Aureimonas sp. AU20]|uniref:bifunctional DNA primase/polymerase n=1 Tax=Aureimonas sp. AU20 TaxID=1349819 RepID=UPI00071ED2DF|nr:bifunctional DNA primase/polymerase [Aureimonas sp. AU20]ALN75846.1 hypothetical protein M673_24122 [Aureimonas sp. AU20]
MGIFSEWQPQYAERGIATFPVLIEGKDKRPASKGWQNVGRPGSRALAEKFRDCNAFGINLKANRFVVLDVDTPDERVLADALSKFGHTPFVVRTGSRNHQAWYRGAGQKRSIRPDPSKPIDILGDGFAVGAPSLGAKGRYEIISGSLDDLAALPPMRSASEAATQPTKAGPQSPKVGEGQRSDTLFRACMKAASKCSTEEELIAFATGFSEENFNPPLSTGIVLKTARSAWGYEEIGENKFGRGREVSLPNDFILKYAASYPDAFALLLILRANHWGRTEFVLSRAMAGSMKWTLPRWRAARDFLEQVGEIHCTHSGGQGANDPPRFEWTSKGCEIVPQ